MKFTFGIITKSDNNFGSNDPSSSDKTNIIKAIESINKLNIPEFEIIVVGGDDIYEQDNIIHFKFDEGTGVPTSHDNRNHGSAVTTSSGFSWKIPDTAVNILNWALTPLAQKAASILLSQQSKDVFYREASVALDKIYNGSI